MRSEDYIKNQIEKANYCDTKEDCISAGNKCPFGCYIYVNKNEVDRISKLVNSHISLTRSCLYDCIECEAGCKDKKCEAVCE